MSFARPLRFTLASCLALAAARPAVASPAPHDREPLDDVVRVALPTRGWVAHFDATGFELQPFEGGWTWGLELVEYGPGVGGAGDPAPASRDLELSSVPNGLTRHWSDAVDEWYRRAPSGLEHGYTLWSPPGAGAADTLTLELRQRGTLTPRLTREGRDVELLDEHGALAMRYVGLKVLDADQRELDARFDTSDEGLTLRIDARDARYPITVDPTAQRHYVKASGAGSNFFGRALAFDGDTLVVGAPGEDSGTSGVGAPETGSGAPSSGAVYVFVRGGPLGWMQQAFIKPVNTRTANFFGESVALSGDTLIVGVPRDNSSSSGVDADPHGIGAYASGAVHVFERSGTNWSFTHFVKAAETDPGDHFGATLAIDGDRFVVGAWGEDSASTGLTADPADDSAANAGAAYVFERSGSSWVQTLYVKASNAEQGDNFGAALDLWRDRLVVGAKAEDSGATGVGGDAQDNGAPLAGATYVFESNGGAWSETAYLKAHNTGADDNFGATVALDGDRLLVAATQEDSDEDGLGGSGFDDDAAGAGAVYVFEHVAGAWSQTAYWKARSSDASDRFGSALALDGDLALVGYSREDSAASGIDGDSTDNSLPRAGAAHLFHHGPGGWESAAYVKASHPGSEDDFGHAVALKGGEYWIGAPLEASAATGVGGDPSDDSLPNAGAVYGFVYDGELLATPYCFGTGSACPCANDNDGSLAGGEAGCANSVTRGGARLFALGTSKLAAADLELVGEGLPPGAIGLLFQGRQPIEQPFVAGLRCAGGAVVRLGLGQADASGVLTSAGLDVGALGGASSGDVLAYQLWYRDPALPSCTETSNLTNGLEIVWGP